MLTLIMQIPNLPTRYYENLAQRYQSERQELSPNLHVIIGEHSSNKTAEGRPFLTHTFILVSFSYQLLVKLLGQWPGPGIL